MISLIKLPQSFFCLYTTKMDFFFFWLLVPKNIKELVVFIVLYITLGIICYSNVKKSQLELTEILDHCHNGIFVTICK